MEIKYFNPENRLQSVTKHLLIDFLHRELEQYGDPYNSIEKSVDYAMAFDAGKGGIVAAMYDAHKIIGAAVVNFTGMKEYIPENILVYIAVDRDYRGKGFGKQLLADVIQHINGNIALHVEPDNPAVNLYRSLGFCSKYHEMRLLREGN